MSNSPPTFGTDPGLHSDVEWSDHATLHRRNYGGGLIYELTAMRRGTLAELIRHVLRLPERDRKDLVIEKAGDHRLDWVEIMGLSQRPDFPTEAEAAH